MVTGMSTVEFVGNSHLLGCAVTFGPSLQLSSLNLTQLRLSSAPDWLSILQRGLEERPTWVQLPPSHRQGWGWVGWRHVQAGSVVARLFFHLSRGCNLLYLSHLGVFWQQPRLWAKQPACLFPLHHLHVKAELTSLRHLIQLSVRGL